MKTPRRKGALALAFVATIGVGIIEGFVAQRVFQARAAETLNDWRNRLADAAAQQSVLVGSWVADSNADAQLVAAWPMIPLLLQPGVPPSERAAARAHFQAVLGAFVSLPQKYRTACVVDPQGRVIESHGDPLDPGLINRVLARMTSAAPGVADIYYEGESEPVVVVAAPVRPGGPAGPVAGVVLLASSPQKWLYPQMLRQPIPSDTSESLLTVNEKGRVVLLCPTRYLVRPVPVHTLPDAAPPPGVRAPAGVELDYRGVPVVAAARPVEGTRWIVVAKIDQAEVLGGFGRAATSTLTWWAVLGAAMLTVVYGLFRHRQTLHLREQVESTRQIGFLNRLLRTLSEVNELMVREKDRQRLLDETCRIVVEHAGFRMAWVGEMEGPSGWIVPVASAGVVDGYLDGINIRWDDSVLGRGPTGTAIRERRTVAVDDVAAAPVMEPWRERALSRGYRGAAAVPMVLGDTVLGALMVYTAEAVVLGAEALSLLEKLATDLAFALDVIERSERQARTELALSEREEQLRQSQKMEAVGRLAGGVAHDFNNLLMAISGYAELALSAKTDEVRRERIEEIAMAADRAAALTRQLLAFSRKQVLKPRVFDPNAVVAELQKMLRRLIGENIQLIARLAPDLDNVRADPGQLEQVLVNLAVNARDAMPNGGRLVIETANVRLDDEVIADLPEGSYVTVTVSDTGVGMAPEVLEHLFEPFFTTKESGQGTGLGLSMVYGILKQSGGAITVDTVPGEGSTFKVFLPAATTREERMEATPTPNVASGGGEALMVVEDNAAVREFVIEALRAAGYRVLSAESAERALEVLASAKHPIDLLLTDVVLPRMDGYELAKEVVATRPSLKVVYMSGYVENPRLREAALHERIDLIEKPFTSAAITARVRAALDRSAT